jgi:DNA gyrase subunit A
MGVKFVTPKEGDAVAVVTRSVESPEDVLEEASGTGPADDESPDVVPDATIESGTTSSEVSPESEDGPADD